MKWLLAGAVGLVLAAVALSPIGDREGWRVRSAPSVPSAAEQPTTPAAQFEPVVLTIVDSAGVALPATVSTGDNPRRALRTGRDGGLTLCMDKPESQASITCEGYAPRSVHLEAGTTRVLRLRRTSLVVDLLNEVRSPVSDATIGLRSSDRPVFVAFARPVLSQPGRWRFQAQALAQCASGKSTVVPIWLEPCDVDPTLTNLQGTPRDGTVSERSSEDALQEITASILELVEPRASKDTALKSFEPPYIDGLGREQRAIQDLASHVPSREIARMLNALDLDDALLPTTDELCRLPRWAAVALAVRTAWRVSVVFDVWCHNHGPKTAVWPHNPDMYVYALRWAETSAAEGSPAPTRAATLSEIPAAARCAADEAGYGSAAWFAADAAAAAADAVVATDIGNTARACLISSAQAAASFANKRHRDGLVFPREFTPTSFCMRARLDLEDLLRRATRKNWSAETSVAQSVFAPRTLPSLSHLKR